MKCIFSISFLLSVLCITTSASARAAHDKRKPTEQRHPNMSSHKAKAPKKVDTPSSTEKKTEPTTNQVSTVTTRTVEQIIQDTTDKTKMAQFGIAAMLKAFKEQAENKNNLDQSLFTKDAKIGDEIMTTKSLKEAEHLVLKLDKRTQTALFAAIKQYPIFKQKSVANDFFNARTTS